jgi:hypothetical protein
MGRRHEILALGGINTNTFDHYTVIMKRAMGLLDADVDGIYFFEPWPSLAVRRRSLISVVVFEATRSHGCSTVAGAVTSMISRVCTSR